MGVQLLGEKYSQKEDMGAGGQNPSALSYTDIFYQCLPHYLAMGMSADEFWNCDPKLYSAYREKDRIENERKNELLWIAGAYVRDAIQSCFSTEQNPHPYPGEPYDLHLRDAIEEEKEPTVEEIQKTPQFVAIVDWMNRVNKQKEGENNGR